MADKAKRSKTTRIALCGMLIAAAMMFSYLETFLPMPVPVPGVKPGIANAVTIFCMFTLSLPETAAVALLRVLLAGLLFQNPVVITYSLAGAVCSVAGMYAAKRVGIFGFTGISVIGAVLHNLGQCATAAVLMENGNLLWYMSVLLITGTFSGVIVGVIAGLIIKRVAAHVRN